MLQKYVIKYLLSFIIIFTSTFFIASSGVAGPCEEQLGKNKERFRTNIEQQKQKCGGNKDCLKKVQKQENNPPYLRKYKNCKKKSK
jgi:hypothetical protein